jgi:hypothetical protein
MRLGELAGLLNKPRWLQETDWFQWDHVPLGGWLPIIPNSDGLSTTFSLYVLQDSLLNAQAPFVKTTGQLRYKDFSKLVYHPISGKFRDEIVMEVWPRPQGPLFAWRNNRWINLGAHPTSNEGLSK